MDTICAPATSQYESAISIVRISGDHSLEILQKIFVTKKEIKSRYFHYGHIVNDGVKLDEVMAVYFKAPYSYTAEDVVEIHLHGGAVSTNRVMELIIRNGARLAEAGEFTKRAFLNGRIDLTQAESVMDMISAKNNLAFDVALDNLEGSTNAEIRSLRERVLHLISELTVSIDYPEEDIEEITKSLINEVTSEIIDRIELILDLSKKATNIKNGVRVAIIGRANVGKSSFLNAITGINRAIVTDIEGTTRDTIEVDLNLPGITLTLIDTAGIRDTLDEVEKIGVEKSKHAANEADILFVIIDASNDLTEEEIEILEKTKTKDRLVLINKIDLNEDYNIEEIENYVNKEDIVLMSAKQKIGFDIIEKKVLRKLNINDTIRENPLVSSNRQLYHLKEAKKSLHIVRESNAPYDFLMIDLKDAYDSLGSVIGEALSGDLTNEIFSKFCLGK